ncbi:MAG TPA: hypothetical protein VH183_15660 [Burkholderiaceae bacterium]|jgi:hypothetical protein|nr:hypothetical protein [Burkholderiaceae bacterium]
MSNPYLVVVRAGDTSLHPLWLATGGQRNWDLVVNYSGDNALRYPTSGEAMVRIDSKGPKWPALHALLSETSDAWRHYEYVWLPDDDLIASCGDINRMFELMAALDLHLAQPSMSWDSQAASLLMVHNPNFALRYTSFFEPIAPVFSRSLLRKAAPTFRESLHGSALGYVWPKFLDNPARQCAILDRMQVTATRRHAADNSASLPRGSASPAQEMDQLLGKHGVPAPLQVAYGGMDSNGKVTTLFDEQGDRFIYKLCEGYLGCAMASPGLLGEMFAEHTRARREFLREVQKPVSVATARAAPAAAAVQVGTIVSTEPRPAPQDTIAVPLPATQAAHISRPIWGNHEQAFKI